MNSALHQSHACTCLVLSPRRRLVSCRGYARCCLMRSLWYAIVGLVIALALWRSQPKRTVASIAHFGLARGFVSP